MQFTNKEIIHQHMNDLRHKAREHARAMKIKTRKKIRKKLLMTQLIAFLKR